MRGFKRLNMKNYKIILILAILIVGMTIISACVGNSNGSKNVQSTPEAVLHPPTIPTTILSPSPTTEVFQDKEFRLAIVATLESIVPILGDTEIDTQYNKIKELGEDALKLEIQCKRSYDTLNSIPVSKNYQKLKEYELNMLYNEQKWGETLKLAAAASNQGNEALAVDIIKKGGIYAGNASFYMDKANNELKRIDAQKTT